MPMFGVSKDFIGSLVQELIDDIPKENRYDAAIRNFQILIEDLNRLLAYQADPTKRDHPEPAISNAQRAGFDEGKVRSLHSAALRARSSFLSQDNSGAVRLLMTAKAAWDAPRIS